MNNVSDATVWNYTKVSGMPEPNITIIYETVENKEDGKNHLSVGYYTKEGYFTNGLGGKNDFINSDDKGERFVYRWTYIDADFGEEAKSYWTQDKKEEAKDFISDYEIMVIVSPKFDEDEVFDEIEKTMTKKFRSNIDKVDKWGKKRLAYEITDSTGEVFTHGYYALFAFSALNEDAVAIFDWVNKLEDKVLRAMMVRKE